MELPRAEANGAIIQGTGTRSPVPIQLRERDAAPREAGARTYVAVRSSSTGGRMTTGTIWQDASARLTAALRLDVAPIAITFRDSPAEDVAPFADPSTAMPVPTPDG